MKGRSKLLKFLLGTLLVALVGLAGAYFFLAEREPPTVSLSPDRDHVSPQTEFSLEIADPGSGLASVSVTASQDGPEKTLVKESFDRAVGRVTRSFRLANHGFDDGQVLLQVSVRDASWSNLLRGNVMTRPVKVSLDSQPPQITLESFSHNLNRGGSGLAGFTVSEEVSRAGIAVGDYFFPAYRQDNGLYLCFFSFPFNAEPGQDRPLVIAEDKAGNTSRAGFHYYVNDKRFARTQIPISDNFLQTKMVQFESRYPNQKEFLDLFLKVNRDLRQKNRQQLLDIARDTVAEPLWSDRFLRQPGAARRAAFGTRRTYVYQGERIDRQTHLGVDLASVARDEVPAANDGRIAYAGWLGIYGQIVIIDHGLGVQTMYAHLSQVQVSKGQRISKGDILGRTGATGLAGGDHLHFAALVSGVPVNPVEWWDQAWIENNILPKLELRTMDTSGTSGQRRSKVSE
jgi:murein DD-endopeptidase MepM/ murein hydrolase activator NlpD